MKLNDPDYVVVGEGNEMVEKWADDFGAMRDIGRLLLQAEEADHDIAWETLAACLLPLNLQPNQARAIKPDDVHEFLQHHPGTVIDTKSPGSGDHCIRVTVQADSLLEVSVTVEALASALYAYWESSEASEPDADPTGDQET